MFCFAKASAVLAAATLASGVLADRSCVNATTAWALSDFRYQAPDPTTPGSGGDVVVSAYITPARGSTLYSCFLQWPVGWDGRINGSETSALIWGDCNWTGPSDTLEVSVSLAVDWKAKKAFMGNSYKCSDEANKGNLTVAVGSLDLELDDCESTFPMCFTHDLRYPITAEAIPTTPTSTAAAAASCASPPASFSAISWSVEDYRRDNDGLNFKLRNDGSGELFSCSGGLSGACEATEGVEKNSAAMFSYDEATTMISVTQTWAACGEADGEAAVKPSSASGAGWMQELCDGFADGFVCSTSDPFWIGASTM